MKHEHMTLPDDVVWIIEALNHQGFEAYVVGGAVRNYFLGVEPKDYDLATSATPDHMRGVFGNEILIPTGEEFGTMTLLGEEASYEITTYRKDGRYSDSRHPDDVCFTNDIFEDLARRDFTINAIAYHPKIGFVDPYNGFDDIRKGIVRAVGFASERFREDPLRMIRAIRIANKYNFQITYSTGSEIISNSHLIKKVSQERIREELNKIIIDSPTGIYKLKDFCLLKHIIPELNDCFYIEQNNWSHKFEIVADHIIESMHNIDAEIHLRLAMMLHDIGKASTKTTDDDGVDHFYRHEEISSAMAIGVLRSLKYDNRTIDVVERLIAGHMRTLHPTKKSIRKTLNAVGEDIFFDLVKVQIADDLAKDTHRQSVREMISHSVMSEEIAKRIIADKECFKVTDLAIDGNDLISIGMKEGREIGEMLNKMLEIVIEEPDLNHKEYLLDVAVGFMDGSIAFDDDIEFDGLGVIVDDWML